jgi:putative (di)nucleoside polyphosphate hydrolase
MSKSKSPNAKSTAPRKSPQHPSYNALFRNASTPPVNEAIAELLAEPEIQLILRADRVDERELLTTLTAMAAGLIQTPETQSRDESSIISSQYRPGVGIILLNDKNQVFVGHRADAFDHAWQMPQGGIDTDESPHEAALRELTEEIGTNNIEILAETRTWLHYDLPEDTQCAWKGRWKGQRQKWFVMRYLGEDSEINIATEHPEFNAWRWVPHQALPDLAVSFKRQVYLNLIREFDSLMMPNQT